MKWIGGSAIPVPVLSVKMGRDEDHYCRMDITFWPRWGYTITKTTVETHFNMAYYSTRLELGPVALTYLNLRMIETPC